MSHASCAVYEEGQGLLLQVNRVFSAVYAVDLVVDQASHVVAASVYEEDYQRGLVRNNLPETLSSISSFSLLLVSLLWRHTLDKAKE